MRCVRTLESVAQSAVFVTSCKSILVWSLQFLLSPWKIQIFCLKEFKVGNRNDVSNRTAVVICFRDCHIDLEGDRNRNQDAVEEESTRGAPNV